MTDRPLVLRVGRDGSSDAALLGGKGASLARLVGYGVPVPTTAIVTTAAYRAVAAVEELAHLIEHVKRAPADLPVTATSVDEAFLAAKVPSEVDDAIAAYVVEHLSGHALAVRSSATTEDLRGASFAGQYRSSLNVVGAAAAQNAVRLTWASLWHPSAVAYRRAWGMELDSVAMAVVLMLMVDAVQAGVVFTRDPGGGEDMCRVESVDGLGESLVSGAVTPSVWKLPRGTSADVAPPSVLEAMRWSLFVEAREGAAQDVEWAWDGEKVWIVQARPITTTPLDEFDTPLDDHELTSEGIAEMVPGPMTPFVWDVNSFLVEEAFRQTLSDIGPLPADNDANRRFVRRIHGRAALDFDLLSESALLSGGRGASDLEAEYFGTSDASRRGRHTPRGHRRFLRELRVARARRRALDDAVVVIAAADTFDDDPIALATESNEALLAYAYRLIDLGARTIATELAVAAVAAAAFARLEGELTRTLAPAEAAPTAQRLTTRYDPVVAPPARSSRAVFGGPTWSELDAPDEGARPVVDLAIPGAPPLDLERELEAARSRHSRSMPGIAIDTKAHRLRRLVEDTTHALDTREGVKRALFRIGGELREVVLELGTRLFCKGSLANPDDVELLTMSELVNAVRSGSCPTALLQRRRREFDRADEFGPLPPRFCGSPEPTDALEARPASLESRVLTGWAASPGTYRGVGHVVRSADDGAGLRDGDVLVAVSTDASWLPLFLRAGAIVVERGGPLSHAAIVARELGLPAVLNVPGATSTLDGQLLEVDGSRGVIEMLTSSRVETDASQ
jgi:pyruvate,water dikinase